MDPSDFNLPSRFKDWRDGQDSALADLLTATTRFTVAALPTGIGKSPIGMAFAEYWQQPALYLTSTRGLQDQVRFDFAPMGVVDVRGMQNYPCKELHNLHGCDRGPCTEGYRCPLIAQGCSYFDAVGEAARSRLTSTNYSFLFAHPGDDTLGPRPTVVLDEAHGVPDELSAALRVTLDEPELDLPRADRNLQWWVEWAKRAFDAHKKRLEAMGPGKEKRRLKDIVRRLARLADIDVPNEEWVVERTIRGWAWEPLWPAPYAEEMLWRGADRALLMSATIRPATLRYLGLNPEDYTWVEVPSPYPVRNRPIYWWPIGVRLKHSTPEWELDRWVASQDRIIEGRLDRKGLIHTVSYDRAMRLKERSEWKDIMLIHNSKNTAQVVKEFKAMEPPAVLVSPSLTTGYDFPYDTCEYQILSKVPFPNFADSEVGKARRKADDNYYLYLTATAITQAAGRIVRGPEDRGETFLVDDQFGWVTFGNRGLYPEWFMNALMKVTGIPDPPAKIG